MRGETPISALPAVVPQFPYKTKVMFGSSGTCNQKYAAGEIYAYTRDTMQYLVRKPEADSLAPARVVIFPGAQFDFDGYTRISAADFTLDTKPVLVALDASSPTPTIGASCGTASGKWGMVAGNSGFTITGISDDTAGAYVVYVRPAGGGSGLALAQATEDGSAGKVKAKAVKFLADLSASPNFEQTGNEFEAKYFKL